MNTRAGGQGLNLMRADTVILHDVDFNPQIDRQAEDRCHRLGQQRTVIVHRLVSTCAGTSLQARLLFQPFQREPRQAAPAMLML